ncbi:hypothetical protein [Ferruginibacter sp.]
MKFDLFNNRSPFFKFRWFILSFVIVAAIMLYYDFSGKRMFSFSNQQQWSSSGPGSHK